jgi:hypothetical protein
MVWGMETQVPQWILAHAAASILSAAANNWRMCEIHQRGPAVVDQVDYSRINPEYAPGTGGKVEVVLIPVFVGLRPAPGSEPLDVFAEALKPRVEGMVVAANGVEVDLEYDVEDLTRKTYRKQ